MAKAIAMALADLGSQPWQANSGHDHAPRPQKRLARLAVSKVAAESTALLERDGSVDQAPGDVSAANKSPGLPLTNHVQHDELFAPVAAPVPRRPKNKTPRSVSALCVCVCVCVCSCCMFMRVYVPATL